MEKISRGISGLAGFVRHEMAREGLPCLTLYFTLQGVASALFAIISAPPSSRSAHAKVETPSPVAYVK